MRTVLLSIWTLVTVLSRAIAQEDGSPHAVRFVAVEPGIKVEVLDWGGSGRPVSSWQGSETGLTSLTSLPPS